MRHESPEIPAHKAVPNAGVHLLKLLPDRSCHFLLCVVVADGLLGDLKRGGRGLEVRHETAWLWQGKKRKSVAGGDPCL